MPYRKNKQRILDQQGALTAKDCPRCNTVKPVDSFSKSRSYPDGLASLCRECTKKFRLARETPDTRKRLLLSRVKSSAKVQGVPFDLQLCDIDVPSHCPVLGMPLTFGRSTDDKAWRDDSPSLDRIVPSKGYTKDNVLVVSYRANRIKNDATIDELCAVAKFYKNKG